MNRVGSLLEYKGEPRPNTRVDLGVGPGGPGSPFCPGIFFFCKRVSDGTSNFVT